MSYRIAGAIAKTHSELRRIGAGWTLWDFSSIAFLTLLRRHGLVAIVFISCYSASLVLRFLVDRWSFH